MQINKIASAIGQQMSSGVTKIGRAVQKPDSFVQKANKFVEGRGMNPGRSAFLALVYSCTLIPRLLKARDKDERLEILRRDLVTVTTICFAMKALKAGSCQIAAKKTGLPLVDPVSLKDANPFVKALGYFQERGATAYSADDIAVNYSNVKGKDMLTRFLTFVDENNGNVGKVLTFDRAKTSIFGKKTPDGPLTKASKKLLGNKFDFTQSGSDIINAINKLDENNAGFKAIEEALKNDKSNPVTRFGQGVSSKFETASLVAVAGFLGFGLPKLNEKLTKDKYFNKKDGGTLKPTYQNPNYPLPQYSFHNALNQNERNVFQAFLGHKQAQNDVPKSFIG